LRRRDPAVSGRTGHNNKIVRVSNVATFLVFEPADGARTQSAAERVVFLREKFSPFAFFLTPFWLLRHRLWLAFLVWLLVFIAITVTGGLLGFGPYTSIAAMFFPALVFGMEGVNLRARKLLRKGYRDAGVIIADDLDTAEQRFFETWRTQTPAAKPEPKAPPVFPDTRLAAASAEQNVIGMFPAPGQR
jgi:hypothetical protein